MSQQYQVIPSASAIHMGNQVFLAPMLEAPGFVDIFSYTAAELNSYMLIELYLITIIIYGHSHPHGRMVMKLPLASHNLRPFKSHFVLDVPNGLEFTKDYGFGQRYLMSAFIADFAGRCPARCEVYFSG